MSNMKDPHSQVVPFLSQFTLWHIPKNDTWPKIQLIHLKIIFPENIYKKSLYKIGGLE